MKKIFAAIKRYIQRRHNMHQKNMCAALSFWREHPGVDPCTFCTNQFCGCYSGPKAKNESTTEAVKPASIEDEFEPIDIDLPDL